MFSRLLAAVITLSCVSFQVRAASESGVPALALLKAQAENGDPAAQFHYAKHFSAGSPEQKRWLEGSAQQGYGPAEDELAWAQNYFHFARRRSTPELDQRHLRTHGAAMRTALAYAGRAASKGFSRSQALLALAYGRGYVLLEDRVEAYAWSKIAQSSDVFAASAVKSLRDELLKSLSLDQVKRGELRAQQIRLESCLPRLHRDLYVPQLKLAGIASDGTHFVALINGKRCRADQTETVILGEEALAVKCVDIDTTKVVLVLPPDTRQIVLYPGRAPEVGP